MEGLCGNNCLENPGVPAVEGELSERMLSIKSPPLPELTVMCGGRRGAREPSEAIVIENRWRHKLYPKRHSHPLVASSDVYNSYGGDDWNVEEVIVGEMPCQIDVDLEARFILLEQFCN